MISMRKPYLQPPTTENRTVTPMRRPNAELRTREYLTDAEVAKLTEEPRWDAG
jgi:type 1 fimbriae regulatory protein FimB/type 1 fimbriae regulatory protein FimE